MLELVGDEEFKGFIWLGQGLCQETQFNPQDSYYHYKETKDWQGWYQ